MSVTTNNTGIQVSGEPLTVALSSEHSTILTNEVDSRIVKIRPMATPIDQLSRCGDVRHVGSMKVNFYMADVKAVETEVTRDMEFDKDFVEDAEGSYGLATIYVSKPAIFSETETLMVPELEVDGSPLVIYATEIGSDHVKGLVVNATDDAETKIGDNLRKGMKIVRMGRAAGELDVQSPQYEALPKRSENYCQIFKMQVEESTLHRLSNKEAQWGFSDQEEVAIIDMRQGMEKNFIFGTKAILPKGNGGDEVYLTGGIWNQDGLETFAYTSGNLDESTLISLCRKAFTGGKGSARKILMGGSDFIEALSNLECKRVVVGRDSMVRWGLEFREIKSNFGTLYVIHNEIFDQCGHSADAMIIDPNMMTKYVHQAFNTERLDLRSAGTRNTDAVVITEASCLVLRNPGCHLKIVKKQ